MHHELIIVRKGVRSRVEFGRIVPDEPTIQIEGIVKKSSGDQTVWGFVIEGAIYWCSGTFEDVGDVQKQAERLLAEYLAATGVIRKTRPFPG